MHVQVQRQFIRETANGSLNQLLLICLFFPYMNNCGNPTANACYCLLLHGNMVMGTLTCFTQSLGEPGQHLIFKVIEGPPYASYKSGCGAANKHLPYQLLTVV